MSDRDQGLKVLRAFHRNSPSLSMSFEVFLATMWPDVKKREIYIDGIGFGAREISDSRIESAMRNMATQARGRIPSKWQDFFTFLSNEAIKINWLDAAAYTFTESAKDIAGAAESVGNQLIFTGKILNFFLPVILIFLVLYYLNVFTNGSVVKTAKAFKK